MVYGFRDAGGGELVLKLTPQSQYGIKAYFVVLAAFLF